MKLPKLISSSLLFRKASLPLSCSHWEYQKNAKIMARSRRQYRGTGRVLLEEKWCAMVSSLLFVIPREAVRFKTSERHSSPLHDQHQKQHQKQQPSTKIFSARISRIPSNVSKWRNTRNSTKVQSLQPLQGKTYPHHTKWQTEKSLLLWCSHGRNWQLPC